MATTGHRRSDQTVLLTEPNRARCGRARRTRSVLARPPVHHPCATDRGSATPSDPTHRLRGVDLVAFLQRAVSADPDRDGTPSRPDGRSEPGTIECQVVYRFGSDMQHTSTVSAIAVSPGENVDTVRPQQPGGQVEGKSDDVGRASVDRLDEYATQPLERIGTGLVHRLTG